jgi:hypothetical protein
MYDTFGDKRALFLGALEIYVMESVRSINAELEKPGPALSAIRNALVTFAERKDLSSEEGFQPQQRNVIFRRSDLIDFYHQRQSRHRGRPQQNSES